MIVEEYKKNALINVGKFAFQPREVHMEKPQVHITVISAAFQRKYS
jgi:hypothetical protein